MNEEEEKERRKENKALSTHKHNKKIKKSSELRAPRYYETFKHSPALIVAAFLVHLLTCGTFSAQACPGCRPSLAVQFNSASPLPPLAAV